MSLKKLLFVSSVIFAAAVINAPAQNQNSQPVARKLISPHVAESWKQIPAIGRPPSTDELHLAIGLPLRNSDELSALLAQLYNPASTNFHRYLTTEEFTRRFGPTVEDYQSVMAYAGTNGLRVTGTHPNRLVLDVAGSVPQVEKAFNVTMRTYRHPREARDFYAPDAEPSVNLITPVLQVSGLNNYTTRKPHFRRESKALDANAQPHTGTGPKGTYSAKDLRNTYLPGVTNLTGTGQSVGLLQFDSYFAADITRYIATNGISTSAVLSNVLINPVGAPGDGNGEVTLDIQMVLAMAPGVSKIYVYEATNPTPWVDLLSRMANDNAAKQLSCSWGDVDPSTPDLASEQIFLQMAAQGQSFFNASGDSDAFTNGIPFPSESTNITQVGATTLTASTNTGVAVFTSEAVWNWDITRSPTTYDGVGSSGGISLNFGLPVWQQGMTANLTSAGGSLTKRNVPDVALTGDNVYSISDNGTSAGATAGTSCAAPLWAGFMALVNQQGASNGLSSAGFINPAVYAIGKSASYANCFHDVTSGHNKWTKSTTKFNAVAGYDLCTGWGTPNGINLINALAPLLNTPPSITSAPQSQTNSFGATATFTVSVNGSLPFAFQWYFTNAIPGATNASLAITNISTVNAGNYFVVVTNSYGSVTSSLAALTVSLAPSISGFIPAYGLPNDSVVISGLMFSNVTHVMFNGADASFTVDSGTQITASVPAGVTTGPVSVTTVDGTSTSPTNFTALADAGVPVVNSFSPSSATVNAAVTITGTNFAGVSGVAFNGVSAVFTVDSFSQITAIVPVGAMDGLISVTNSYGVGASATVFTVAIDPGSSVAISQVYGGGGNSGATYQNDYIELYNRSGVTVDLSTWSIQYASSSGTSWSKANLSGSILPGHYYLISAAGGATGLALPTPDGLASGINMSGTKGKVALLSSQTTITSGTSSPVGLASLVDFVGYGSADAYEGSGPAPTISVTLADFRAGAGATDTGDNAADFSAATPNPRNSSTVVAGTDLAVTLTHAGNFTQGGTNFSYTITVTNVGTLASVGTVSVVDTLPAGLTATAISGSGWVTNLATLTCTRSDALAGASAYPPITVTVSVATNAAALVTNIVTVSGGGDVNSANNTATNPTSIAIIGAPSVTTAAASNVGTTTATLNGSLNPNGQTATAQFEYGQTTSYGTTVAVTGTFAGSSSNGVSTNLTGLLPGTTYHFRLAATNASGLTLGADQSFATANVVGPSSFGGVLAAWEVANLSSYGASPLSAASNAPNVNVVGLTRGSGVGVNTANTPAGNAWGGSGFIFSSQAAAITGNSFATFSLTAGAGYTLSCTNIPAYNIRRTSAGSTTGRWQYQVGGGAFTDIGSAITWGTTTGSGGNAQTAIDLSGISALQNVPAGTTVTFRIVLWGGTAVTGTWYVNNLVGGYDLQVQGTLSSTVTVTPPAITVSPSPTNVFAGNNAGFSVTASGTAPLSYQWRKGGVAFADGGAVSGATTNVLSFVPAATNHTGSYSVVVTNAGGSVTSSVAVLNVMAAPGLTLSNSANGLILVADGGAVSNRFIVQMATNLTPPIVWEPLQTNVIGADGLIRFEGVTGGGSLQFYRVVFP